jgi:hypothetical protein
VLCASAGMAMAMIGLQVMQHEIDLRPRRVNSNAETRTE